MKVSTLGFILLLILAFACSESGSQSEKNVDAAVIKETYHTQRDQGDNVDSPAVWHGPEGQHWLLATAKEGDVIIVFDAIDGSLIQRIGNSGTDEGSFERPNGIAVIDNLLLVVERDNKRIQIFSLPDFSILGKLTHEDLRLPYGLTVLKNGDASYELFVSDNYNPALNGYPAQEELDERIHQFTFTVSGSGLSTNHIRVFGDIEEPGALHKVESLYADKKYNRLLIADEAFNRRNIKVYDLQGNFSGEIIPSEYFESEPEGIALYECSDGTGFWIITDQHEDDANKFEVFDRQTLEHIGTFKGEFTRNTDGVWLSRQSFGNFESGAFFPVHDDGSVTAIDLAKIAKALNLPLNCS